jgi:hypothetical protein
MRQQAPWGAPVTNPGAFGVGADDSTFGTSTRMPGVSSDQVRFNAAPTPPIEPVDPITETQNALEAGTSDPSYMAIGKSVALASLGGAFVGWLASGGHGWKGAAIGASTNAALVYAGTALAGRKSFSKGMLAGLVVLGLAAAGGAGYFFMQQRRRR